MRFNISKNLNKSINTPLMKQLNKHRFLPVLLYLVLFGILAFIAAACVTNAGTPEEKPSQEIPVSNATPVDAVVVQPQTVTENLQVTGTIVANQYVDVVSELTRKVIRVNVKEGSHVKKGTLLFLLDDADLQAQLDKLHQQEKLAQLNEVRLKDLLSHDAIAQQDYDQAVMNLGVLKAELEELKVTIEKTRITAPFNGQIGIIKVYPGAIVSVNTILTDIKDNSVVKVEFAVPEKYASIIVPGSTHKFTTTAGSTEYKTTVTARAASLNESTRTLLIHGQTPNHNGQLLHGQSARLDLTLSSSNDVLTLSSNALIPSSQGYTVYRAHKSAVEPVAVQIGQRGAATVEITNGLHQGDTIITSNLLRLFSGAPVQFATLK
jgi:membrane fusion protein, multidrug efflux system